MVLFLLEYAGECERGGIDGERGPERFGHAGAIQNTFKPIFLCLFDFAPVQVFLLHFSSFPFVPFSVIFCRPQYLLKRPQMPGPGTKSVYPHPLRLKFEYQPQMPSCPRVLCRTHIFLTNLRPGRLKFEHPQKRLQMPGPGTKSVYPHPWRLKFEYRPQMPSCPRVLCRTHIFFPNLRPGRLKFEHPQQRPQMPSWVPRHTLFFFNSCLGGLKIEYPQKHLQMPSCPAIPCRTQCQFDFGIATGIPNSTQRTSQTERRERTERTEWKVFRIYNTPFIFWCLSKPSALEPLCLCPGILC